MKKPQDLKKWLENSVREVQKNPEKLQLFIDSGNLDARLTNYDDNLCFEYQYDLNLIVTDFAVHTDHLMVPLLAWLKLNQTDLAADAVQFEADILDHDKIDLSITITGMAERVIVTLGEDGNYTTVHPGEPEAEYNLPDPAALADLIPNG